MYSHTIAISRCLLIEGRTHEVVEMITPLLHDGVHGTSPRERDRIVLLRCLLAQAQILGDTPVETVRSTLSFIDPAYSMATSGLSNALSLLWLGWAQILDDSEPNIPYAIHLLRTSHQQLEKLHRGDYLYWAQIGHAMALSRLGQHAQMQDLVNEIMTCTSFARDELAQMWMRKLLKDDLATWCKHSTNVMNASYSKGAFLKECKLVAEGDAPVLFTGERGAGKESTGRLIHEMGQLASDTFMCIDCEAISNSQYPFSLPLTPSTGLLNTVETIFLNHVEQLPAHLQADLLAFAETRANETNAPRIFAATSANIETHVEQGNFDRNLYNFLQINRLHVAPLRSRVSDIPLLALHYAHQFCPPGVPFVGITEEALSCMLQYTWPGNVRQLRNEIERAISFLASEPIPVIDSRVLPAVIRKRSAPSLPQALAFDHNHDLPPLEEVLASTEKKVIEEALARTHGQVSVSASRLGLTRQGLYKKIKRLGILVSRFQDDVKPNSQELLN